jgi:hypothetical protein
MSPTKSQLYAEQARYGPFTWLSNAAWRAAVFRVMTLQRPGVINVLKLLQRAEDVRLAK